MSEITINAAESPLVDDFRQAFQRVVGAVCVLTVADDQQRWHGMTATSVVSVSLAPPSLLVCINMQAAFYALIDRRQTFCVNILSHGHERHGNCFSRPAGRDARFTFGEWNTHGGLPYLGDAQAAIFCDVARKVVHGSHAVFIGNVTDVIAPRRVKNPLIYFNRHYLPVEGSQNRSTC